MRQNIKWYLIDPIDTLFFKTAEPMEMGESHDAKYIFPPTPQTIIGAFRTLYLKKNNISFKDYFERKVDQEILSIIGDFENANPFEIIGPFFKEDIKYFIPAPYCWYVKKRQNDNNIFIPEIINKNKLDFIKIKDDNFLWINEDDVETIGGRFILLDDFINLIENYKNFKSEYENGKISLNIKELKDFFYVENRVGIALEKDKRKARKGHIYNFPHIRLNKNVSLVIGIDKDLDIEKEGIIEIGAEKRKAYYKEVEDINGLWNKFDNIKSEFYMSLTLIEGGESNEQNQNLFSTGKIQYIGGWDLKKGFHKPLKGYYPQGSVFTKNIKSICVPVILNK